MVPHSNSHAMPDMKLLKTLLLGEQFLAFPAWLFAARTPEEDHFVGYNKIRSRMGGTSGSEAPSLIEA